MQQAMEANSVYHEEEIYNASSNSYIEKDEHMYDSETENTKSFDSGSWCSAPSSFSDIDKSDLGMYSEQIYGDIN